MKTERIEWPDRQVCAAVSVRVPDIRWIGAFFRSRDDEACLRTAYRVACDVRRLIVERDPDHSIPVEFDIDIPNLLQIAHAQRPVLREELRVELMRFTRTFGCLVKHLIERPMRVEAYSLDETQAIHGVRYVGLGWANRGGPRLDE